MTGIGTFNATGLPSSVAASGKRASHRGTLIRTLPLAGITGIAAVTAG
jgi:hypothetical protein